MFNKDVQVNAINCDIKYSRVSFYDVTECPVCKAKIEPMRISSLVNHKNSFYYLSALYFCSGCNSAFFTEYPLRVIESYPDWNSCDAFGMHLSVPDHFVPADFDDLIKGISPVFIEIYNQSLSAESNGLSQIAGIGYRKALEFLIKDFLISESPDQQAIIEQMPLAKCIQDKIDNPQLKTVAQRATWLGNDHTHYVQKYDDKDIEDLKRLIRLSVHWISLILETKEAEVIEKK